MQELMPPPLMIRPMTSADAPAAASLSEQLGYVPLLPALIADRLASFAFSQDHGCYVAERDEHILGWVDVFSVHMLVSPCFFAEIGGLVVGLAERRQGIGRALVAQAELWAAEHGYTEVRLRSGLHRTDAHEFYQSVGYEIAKTSHMFRKKLSAEPSS
jgi:GNAT superfamily N-acetyltransferase